MTFRNRKTVRADAATSAGTAITALQETYGYRPKDFDGKSPVLTIESAFSFPQLEAQEDVFGLAFTFYVLRDDAAGAEDLLDDLELAFKNWVLTWDVAFPIQESEINVEVVGKQQYLYERHVVQVGSVA